VPDELTLFVSSKSLKSISSMIFGMYFPKLRSSEVIKISTSSSSVLESSFDYSTAFLLRGFGGGLGLVLSNSESGGPPVS
jgi:hypothetical protein